ncbi:lysM domain-containing GPI-anchored protein 1 isoform X2 [Vigna radiata var. radiata]|uniref:LysM domain-containing GPI-anchored protein 1 isoform X2 n=1 Tax=Vigna radiata var. radiata TaxID=3916 RepID=A0A1S3UQN4_VIGRR|nr:lysM domain-containing GPI-anchored protein 1 isoform X2 [Vigna radiata var. radiata]
MEGILLFLLSWPASAYKKMRNSLQFVWPGILCLMLLSFEYEVETKSTIEACNSSDSCPSLLSYLLPWDSKVSEIATRFHVNASDILASNSLFPITSSSAHQILRAKTFVKIPIFCSCVDGIRRSMSTVYTVRAADTAASISEGYGGLVSGEQIKILNSINGSNPLRNGGTIVIPLPCTCFNNVNNGGTAVYMSYVVQRRESLSSIAAKFGTTISDLKAVNGFSEPTVDPGDIISLPIAACSSATLKWYDESMIVPNGSYTLTASNCIKCSCQPMDITMRCVPSGLAVPCYNLRCKQSNLIIGSECVEHSETACNVIQCVYRGHRGGKILSSMKNSSYLQCPDNVCHRRPSCWPFSAYSEDPFGMSPKTSSSLPLPVSKASQKTSAFNGRLAPFLINVLQIFLFLKFILYFLI